MILKSVEINENKPEIDELEYAVGVTMRNIVRQYDYHEKMVLAVYKALREQDFGENYTVSWRDLSPRAALELYVQLMAMVGAYAESVTGDNDES